VQRLKQALRHSSHSHPFPRFRRVKKILLSAPRPRLSSSRALVSLSELWPEAGQRGVREELAQRKLTGRSRTIATTVSKQRKRSKGAFERTRNADPRGPSNTRQVRRAFPVLDTCLVPPNGSRDWTGTSVDQLQKRRRLAQAIGKFSFQSNLSRAGLLLYAPKCLGSAFPGWESAEDC